MKFYTSKTFYLLLFKSFKDALQCNHTRAGTLENAKNQRDYYTYHMNKNGDTVLIEPNELLFVINTISSPHSVNWKYYFVIAGDKTGWVPIHGSEFVITEVRNESK